jgi:hypothetical protein
MFVGLPQDGANVARFTMATKRKTGPTFKAGDYARLVSNDPASGLDGAAVKIVSFQGGYPWVELVSDAGKYPAGEVFAWARSMLKRVDE